MVQSAGMRRVALMFAASVLLGACERASVADPLAGLYGNTWEMRTASEVNRFHVNSDGSWTGWFDKDPPVSGQWSMEDGIPCFRMAGETEAHCDVDVIGKRPGDRWTTVDDGETFEATIHRGRA